MVETKLRLSLRRETIRTLDESELGRVVGGGFASLGCNTGAGGSCGASDYSGGACSQVYGTCQTLGNTDCTGCGCPST